VHGGLLSDGKMQMSRHDLRHVTKATMIDLHQGFSGRELDEVPPTLTSLAVVQLDAATALARGELRRAARGQLAAARLLGQALVRGVRERFRR
jgi:hypothetical protein